MNNCVAIIIARGGSKRIPQKNIRDFHGLPIISYSINAALKSGCFDEVMVSTDNTNIAKIAKKFGAEVPFFRSAENAGDFATTSEVILEVLNSYMILGRNFDYACCIYPTAPFINAEKINYAFQMLTQQKASSVMPVVKFSYPILRALKMDGCQVSFLWPEHRLTRSQDLPSSYHDAGQFYFINVKDFLTQKEIINTNTLGFEVPETEVHDIDNEIDWSMAELKYKMVHNG